MQSVLLVKDILGYLALPFKTAFRVLEFAKNKLKGGGRNANVWSDKYPMPNWNEIDWNKTDEEIAHEIALNETQKGAGTTYNKIRKYIQEKRRERKNKKS